MSLFFSFLLLLVLVWEEGGLGRGRWVGGNRWVGGWVGERYLHFFPESPPSPSSCSSSSISSSSFSSSFLLEGGEVGSSSSSSSFSSFLLVEGGEVGGLVGEELGVQVVEEVGGGPVLLYGEGGWVGGWVGWRRRRLE